MENPPFEDVFPIQDGDFPLLCLFTGGYIYLKQQQCSIKTNVFQITSGHPLNPERLGDSTRGVTCDQMNLPTVVP